jgi:hypothetical protein
VTSIPTALEPVPTLPKIVVLFAPLTKAFRDAEGGFAVPVVTTLGVEATEEIVPVIQTGKETEEVTGIADPDHRPVTVSGFVSVDVTARPVEAVTFSGLSV